MSTANAACRGLFGKMLSEKPCSKPTLKHAPSDCQLNRWKETVALPKGSQAKPMADLHAIQPTVSPRRSSPIDFPNLETEETQKENSVLFVRSCLTLMPMHPLFHKASSLTETIIAAAIEVHRDKGPGLIESIYEWCLLKELGLRGLACVSQKSVLVEYKGFTREEPLRFDLLVERCVLVEAKAVEKVLAIHKAQLLSYMKLLDVSLGLL